MFHYGGYGYDLEEDVGTLCCSTFCSCFDSNSWFWKSCRKIRKTQREKKWNQYEEAKKEEEKSFVEP